MRRRLSDDAVAMRLSSGRRRPARRRGQRFGSSVALLATIAPALSQAIQFTPAPPANLDLSNLGKIGIAGDFSGISLYEYEGQVGKPRSLNGSESLLAELPNGALASIVSTDASIRSMCVFKDKGVVIGGNFTSLDGTQSTAIAMFDPNTNNVTPIEGLEGQVNSILCDNDKSIIYVGGNFKGGNSTNAIAWADGNWQNLPFAGFNGPVNAITKASNGHIIFGGSFTGLGNLTTPSTPDSQIINLPKARVVAENSISRDGFSNPENILCASGSDQPGNTWLVQDSSPGFWEAQFDFGFQPTKLRLWNTHLDGRGTKTFRFLAYPINGIMNFTYTDPATGQNQSCTSECPLSDNPDTEFQDFHFVNRVGMDRFRIAISDWYGSGAGLGGIQLFQDNIFAYAINSFNEPSCRGVQFPSTASSTGPWKESPSLQSSSNYLTAQVKTNDNPENAAVVFTPNIRESGNYSVNLYTPGCKPDESCENRGRVNVTGTMSSTGNDAKFGTTLFQTNNFDKYDQIYFGYIEKTSDSFKPTVTIRPTADQRVEDLTVVAQRIGFSLIGSSGGLNGLFDFDPSDEEVDASDLDKSAINKLGYGFDEMSGVKSLVTAEDVMYVAGNFTSEDHKNILAISGGKDVKALDGGLNGQVLGMHLEGKKLYVGGDFSNTLSSDVSGLNNAAVYDADANTWNPLGGGVDGTVEYVVPLQVNITKDKPETVIALTGTFSTCNEFADSKAIRANGLAIWVPSEGNWLQNSKNPVPSFSGTLTASLMDIGGNNSLLAGSISSAQLSANGAATLSDKGLGKFAANIDAQAPPSPSNSANQRRAVLSGEQPGGVVTGTFYEENGKNITILAGHFTAQATDGSTINNLVLIDGDKNDNVTGLGDGISADSTFTALALRGSTLFAGGKISGEVDGGDVSGMVIYDVESKSFKNQAASLSGANATVSAITVREKSSDVYVAGSFDKAGALECPGLCLYNADSEQWTRPGSGLSGDVNCLIWTSNSMLLVGGDLQTNGTETQPLAMLDTKKQTWSNFPKSDSIPGPVQVIAAASKDGKQVWIAGKSSQDQSIFLMKYDGEEWHTVDHGLAETSVLRGLQMFTLTKGHDKTDILDEKQSLMVTGTLELANVGTVSAALFNGTNLEPYALTTSTGNGAGSIAKIFSQKDDFFAGSAKHLALGFVVLIGLAISLALILLLVVAGIVLDRIRKRREGYTPAPTSMYDRGSGIQRVPPRELLESLGKVRPGGPPAV